MEKVAEKRTFRERAERFAEKSKVWTEKYFLRIFAVAAALLVFVIGFFMQIRYKPNEQVQASASFDGSIPSADDILPMLAGLDIGFDQGMFNAIAAMFVGVSEEDYAENTEKYAEESEKVMNDLGKFLLENDELVLRFAALLQSSDIDTDEFMSLYKELKQKAPEAIQTANLVLLDRLEAEVGYGSSEEPSLEKQKLADETIFRTALLVIEAAVYLYLQIVALCWMIFALAGIVGKKKADGKFYFMYLIGFFVLMLFGQITATGLNGAAIACFVLVSVFGGLHVLGKMFVRSQTAGERAMNVLRIAGTAFLFAAACLFSAGMYNFGVSAHQLGAVFGLNCYNGTVFEEGMASEMLVVNFLPAVLLHIAGLVLVLAAMFANLKAMINCKKGDVALSFVAAGLMFLFYVSFSICASFGAFELQSVGVQMLVISMLAMLAGIAEIIRIKLSNGETSSSPETDIRIRDAERRAVEAEFRAREAELRAEFNQSKEDE